MPSIALETATEWGRVLPFSGFELDRPQLWERYGGEWVEHPHDFDDIYILAARFRFRSATRSTALPTPQAFGVVTTGWAAPLNSDGTTDCAPSENPNRKRCALLCVYGADGTIATALRFSDNTEEVISGGAEGTGSLADALDACAVALWGTEFVGMFAARATDTATDPTTRAALVARLVELTELLNDTDTNEGETE